MHTETNKRVFFSSWEQFEKKGDGFEDEGSEKRNFHPFRASDFPSVNKKMKGSTVKVNPFIKVV